MNTLITAEVISDGGRSGKIYSPSGLMDLTLGNPLEKNLEKSGPNPEMLFGGAYAACFHSALIATSKKRDVPTTGSTVRALVSLIEEEDGGLRLDVEIRANIPNANLAEVHKLMEEAHKNCPYSKALRGDVSVTLLAV